MHSVALIGAGRIGQVHARNAAHNPHISLAAVVDPYAQNAQSVASEWGPQIRTLDEVLEDSSICGVIIASATDTHLDHMLQASRAGKIIFCEKPVDQDLKRARQAEAELAEATILLGFNRRFDPSFSALAKKVCAGAIGTVETVHIKSNDPAPPSLDYIAVSGGLFKDMAIHDFDMARWLVQEEVAEVFASGSCLVDPGIGEAGDIDTAQTILKFQSGKMCVISNSRRSGFGYDQRVEIFGSAGMANVKNQTETSLEVWTENGSKTDCFQNFFLDRYAAAYAAEMDHFAAVLSGTKPLISYCDGVAALAIAEAAQKSHSTNQIVRL